MDSSEISSSLEHEFLLTRLKQELAQVNDNETLRRLCLELIDLSERQKAMFKQMLYNFIDMADVDEL